MTVRSFTSFCPATGEDLWTGCAASPDEVEQAVAGARGAFRAWRDTPLAQRIEIASAYAAVLRAQTDTLAETIARETGQPRWEARQEVASVIGKLELSIAAQAERAGVRR